MFGKHWTAASGVVVDKHSVGSNNTDGVLCHEYIVDVTAADGQLFRAKVEEPRIAIDFMEPRVGQTVGVEYDDDRKKVRFDKDDKTLSMKAYRNRRNDHFEDALSQPAGTPVDPTAGNPYARQAPAGAGFDVAALLKAQGLTAGGGEGFTPQVIQMNAASPEAAALREALLRAMGGAPAPDAGTPSSEPGA